MYYVWCKFVSLHTLYYLYADETRLNLLKVTQERDQIRREREEQVAALNSQLHVMERSYETILQVNHAQTRYLYVIISQIHGLSI